MNIGQTYVERVPAAATPLELEEMGGGGQASLRDAKAGGLFLSVG